ncbi:scopoletin glucosyltransferase-like [Dioscorea cayenensis subsp. rotundata]|uniref:Scopoletin glucosyltransferase-like n=1 Tax=Dioscorea cayennensis subsp. rotundata TaxID=55577 RepID=A0AB40BNL8_DIOCR|nr:scopoletin glucosyltransferase-like [Dioscorea cayenensis subsp. rotundata]
MSGWDADVTMNGVMWIKKGDEDYNILAGTSKSSTELLVTPQDIYPFLHLSLSLSLSQLYCPFVVTKTQDLHILFFPYIAPGHMLPMINMAKLFANRGVRTTILTTPANTFLLKPIISNSPLELALIPFSFTTATGLREGYENLTTLPSQDLIPNFKQAVSMLSQPFHQTFTQHHPKVIIIDIFLPWTIEITSKLTIPQLIFNGTGFFPLCLITIQQIYNPYQTLQAKTKSFLVPRIPQWIELLKTQVLDICKTNKERQDFFLHVKEAEKRSYGVVMNSFYELEPDYVEHYRTVTRCRAWHIGHVSLCNENMINSDDRNHECLCWLDLKEPESVLYVCFRSLSSFSGEQIREMALGLEASNHAFIWSLILNHKVVGGFMIHCGWNSTLEDVLKIGVAVGMKEHVMRPEDRPLIHWINIERVVSCMTSIGGVKAEAMRMRARKLREMAKSAIMEDGSSYTELT